MGHLATSCTRRKSTYPLNQPVVVLADLLTNNGLSVDSSTVACSTEDKGVDSNLDKCIHVKDKNVEGVNACNANSSNPVSFDVDCTMYSRDADLEDAWYDMEAI